jgi:hypothetical protein
VGRLRHELSFLYLKSMHMVLPISQQRGLEEDVCYTRKIFDSGETQVTIDDYISHLPIWLSHVLKNKFR